MFICFGVSKTAKCSEFTVWVVSCASAWPQSSFARPMSELCRFSFFSLAILAYMLKFCLRLQPFVYDYEPEHLYL